MAAAASAAAAAAATDMDKNHKISAALAAATCGLLGTASPGVSIAAEAEPAWDIDSAFLYYGESDGRVKDLSLSSHALRDFGDDRKLGLDLSVDSLTGVANRRHAAIHHVGRRHDIGARARVAHRHVDERRQRLVVQDGAVLEDAAMAVIRVRAQADVGHDDQLVAEFALEPLAGFLHRAVGRGRGRAIGRLAAVLGMAEQQHGPDAELEILADLLDDVFEALLGDAGHR